MTNRSSHDPAKRLSKRMAAAIERYRLLSAGDRVLVAMSGGKDSWALLERLLSWSKRSPIQVEITAGHIDLGAGDDWSRSIQQAVAEFSTPFFLRETRIAATVDKARLPGDSPCGVCSKLRRGALLRLAEDHHCNVIALAHHGDDFIETLLMNVFFTGRMATMPVRIPAREGRIRIIRPACLCDEADLAAHAESLAVPITNWRCALGFDIDNHRNVFKRWIDELANSNPHIRRNALAAMGNLRLSHLLDARYHDDPTFLHLLPFGRER